MAYSTQGQHFAMAVVCAVMVPPPLPLANKVIKHLPEIRENRATVAAKVMRLGYDGAGVLL